MEFIVIMIFISVTLAVIWSVTVELRIKRLEKKNKLSDDDDDDDNEYHYDDNSSND